MNVLKMKNKRGGFTLVEVIVVLVILAILAAIMIPSMTGWVDKAHANVCKNDMAFVRRSYLSLAAFDSYQVSDPQPLLEEAAGEAGGTVTGPDTYRADCGGICTVYYSGDRSQINNIICSLHGSLNAQTTGLIYDSGLLPGATFDRVLAEMIVNPDKSKNLTADSIDSTTTTGTNFPKVMAYLTDTLGVDLNDAGIKSWCISKKEGVPVVWWTDQDINNCSPGDSVRVVRYNTSKGTYTAGYITVAEKTLDGATYNVMSASLSGNPQGYFTEYTGQTGTSKADYEQTLKIFNAMPETP